MVLKRSHQRLDLRHDAEEMKLKLQAEYEQLVVKLNAFYSLKKKLFEDKKRKLAKEYDLKQLREQLNDLQESFELQRQAWLKLASHA